MSRYLISTLFLVLSSCGKPDNKVTATKKISVYTFATKTGATAAYCFVQFYYNDSNTTVFPIESDTVVSCNGVAASLQPSGYYSYFNVSDNSPVQVTIIRPQAGTTMSQMVNLQ